MALKTSLKSVVERISAVIRAFVGGQGWDQDDFAIAGAFDRRTGQISLVVGTDRPFDEMHWYAEIRRKLRDEFGSTSSVAQMIVLVVRRVRSLDEVYGELMFNEDEVDLIELL